MGANRTLATPESYPSAFLTAIEYGAGIIYAHDLPWTPGSSMKRFHRCVYLIRGLPNHWLHSNAMHRWSVRATPAALEITMVGKQEMAPSVARVLIERALSI